MRRPRKSRHAQPLPQQAPTDPSAGPLGSWAHADVLALPRFPDRQSFPAAKELVDRFLAQDGLTYRDLRIALFWLGFGLLEAPTPERPTMSLVPLCKDLDLYEDSAIELGYDPSASVHGRPVFLQADPEQWQEGLAVDFSGEGPSSSSSGSHSSSSSSGPHATATSSAGCPPQTGGDPVRQVRQVRARPPEEVSLCLTDEEGEEEEEAWAEHGDRGSASAKVLWRAHAWAENEDDGGDGYGPRGPRSGGGASSRAREVQGVQQEELEASQLLTYKVKLLHAGGWSSSSGSEGNRTPPTPPASSSAAAAAGGEVQAGGLNADHVGQFTVSFISDLELHEELQDTSCLCTFCLDDMEIGEELCRLPCMHTFHRRCVYAWLERDRRCMLCRLDVTRPCG
mmetsp:Transcript_66833/g.195411  ORF Transcript_66833/g.195411 Transcript_66833/m.195411 type:complete len:396 (+) Transcript_66833:77-1264(+)